MLQFSALRMIIAEENERSWILSDENLSMAPTSQKGIDRNGVEAKLDFPVLDLEKMEEWGRLMQRRMLAANYASSKASRSQVFPSHLCIFF